MGILKTRLKSKCNRTFPVSTHGLYSDFMDRFVNFPFVPFVFSCPVLEFCYCSTVLLDKALNNVIYQNVLQKVYYYPSVFNSLSTISCDSLSFLHLFDPSDKLSGCGEDMKPASLMRKSPSLESVIKTPFSLGNRTASFSYNRANSKLRCAYPEAFV